MKEHRRRVGAKEGKTAIAPPAERASAAAPQGIPLLLLPEGVLFDVDASMLLTMPPPDANPDRAEGPMRRIGSTLIRLWFRPWEF
jgi:hypothetical protein